MEEPFFCHFGDLESRTQTLITVSMATLPISCPAGLAGVSRGPSTRHLGGEESQGERKGLGPLGSEKLDFPVGSALGRSPCAPSGVGEAALCILKTVPRAF